MLNIKIGSVVDIIKRYDKMTTVKVKIEDKFYKAINYIDITGNVEIGDVVILNTTAIDLDLGTGGYHFIIYNMRLKKKESKRDGHIIKLRYTPLQLKCKTVEEQERYKKVFETFSSLDNFIVAVGTLHSMLAPIACVIKWLKPKARISYIMTDGGALPIQFSNTVRELKNKRIINNTITIGHSFGGDYECINIYTGLITSKSILKSDVAIITMGPGIVGTGTKYGFSGTEQAYILDAVNKFKGISFAIPRISFSDSRIRHKGISHHTLTVLSELMHSRTNIVLPVLEQEKLDYIMKQIKNYNIDKKHNVFLEDGTDIKNAFEFYEIDVTTMGRHFSEDVEYFYTLGAVAKKIVEYLNNNDFTKI
ncbi:hypothetical protein Y919_00140 [Caloranaerobacter azorensis H53214]|uniref:DUF3866 domain-containing protein n=2 Tax=Caloranaerobacter azorensis TaxID=116090 RepID=A0A096DQ92_9FIRM|nr:hypothetical protein Y919_00140 [Caloranaerobacter azorensis H53214]